MGEADLSLPVYLALRCVPAFLYGLVGAARRARASSCM